MLYSCGKRQMKKEWKRRRERIRGNKAEYIPKKKKERNEEDLFLQFKAPFFCFCGEVLADDG